MRYLAELITKTSLEEKKAQYIISILFTINVCSLATIDLIMHNLIIQNIIFSVYGQRKFPSNSRFNYA